MADQPFTSMRIQSVSYCNPAWGCSNDFHVKHLSGWMFSFHISFKKVGFLIKSLGTFSCQLFAIFFYLWGNGGPNWLREFHLWIDEHNAKWTTVSYKPGNSHNPPKGQSARKSYADIVKSIPPTRTSVFKHLQHPKNYSDTFLGKNHNSLFSSPKESHFRQSSNSNSISSAQSRHSRSLLVWKPKPHAGFRAPQAPLKEQTPALLDPNKLACGPLNRYPRCLGLGHDRNMCKGNLCCEVCFQYGHSRKSCFSKSKSQKFRPVTVKEAEGTLPKDIYAPSSSLTGASPPISASLPPPNYCSRTLLELSDGKLCHGSQALRPQGLHAG